MPGSAAVLVQTPTNVQRIRNSGVEVAFREGQCLLPRARGSSERDLAQLPHHRENPTWIPNAANYEVPWATSVAGKNVPNVPNWRGTLAVTYRPDDRWAFTGSRVATRASCGAPMANNDVAYGDLPQAFDPFFVVDTKINYRWNDRFSFDFGVDNIGNYKYFLFHPFPQRTFYVAAKYEYGRDKKGAPGMLFTGDDGGLPDPSTWFQPVAMNWE